MFAKLFDTSLGQVVVLKQSDEDNNPEIRFYTEPEGMGVCSFAFTFNDDDEGWTTQENAFEKVTLEMAEQAAQELNNFQ